MCGIVAVWSDTYENASESLDFELKAGAHRGPDAQSKKVIEWQGRYLALGWNRLRITGASEEWDSIPENDEGFLLLNGEIYNFRELINKYDLSECANDARVLLAGLQKMGLAFLNECEGMFAGIWVDKNNEQIIAFRDFFGIKPLYYKYSDENKKLIISSEIDIYEDSNDFDFEHLHRFRYKYYPVKSSLEDRARSLQPGEILAFSLAGAQSLGFVNFIFNGDNRNLIDILNYHISLQIPEEVSFGVLSGGGIDSSVICELLYRNGFKEIPIFTLNDGSLHIKRLYKAAEKWGYPIVEVKVPENWKVIAEAFLQFYRLPCYDFAAWFTYLCSKKAAESGIKVLFSGAGADELLGGYRRHRFWAGNAKRLDMFKVFAGLFSGKVHEVLAAPYHDKVIWYHNLGANPSIKVPFNKVSSFNNPYPDFTSKQAQWWDLKYYLPEDVLIATDRGSMLAGVEVRVPFLNGELFRWFERQKEDYFVEAETKHELRAFLNDSDLRFLTSLPKRGFGI